MNAVLAPEVKASTPATLKKYGITVMEWWELFNRQHGQCGICHKDFQPGKRINIDHQHVRGWKNMLPELRKTYIRGLLCYTCNRFMLMRGINAEKLYNGWQYMRNWEVRVTTESLTRQQVRKRRADKPARTTNDKANK